MKVKRDKVDKKGHVLCARCNEPVVLGGIFRHQTYHLKCRELARQEYVKGRIGR